jgi:hypothetical protein
VELFDLNSADRPPFNSHVGDHLTYSSADSSRGVSTGWLVNEDEMRG